MRRGAASALLILAIVLLPPLWASSPLGACSLVSLRTNADDRGLSQDAPPEPRVRAKLIEAESTAGCSCGGPGSCGVSGPYIMLTVEDARGSVAIARVDGLGSEALYYRLEPTTGQSKTTTIYEADIPEPPFSIMVSVLDPAGLRSPPATIEITEIEAP